MGFLHTFCFNGTEAAKEQAKRTEGNVIFWHDKKRMIAIPCTDGVATLPYDTKQEVFQIYGLFKRLEA